MGEARVKVTMRNFVDVALAERGSGTIEDIPTSHLDCLVDTGALMVPLPEDEVGKLALSRGARVIVTYANDHREELPGDPRAGGFSTGSLHGDGLCDRTAFVQAADRSTRAGGAGPDRGLCPQSARAAAGVSE